MPLFIGFVEAGIPLGVTFSFLIASPMINEVAAVILVGILGWELAALYRDRLQAAAQIETQVDLFARRIKSPNRKCNDSQYKNYFPGH